MRLGQCAVWSNICAHIVLLFYKASLSELLSSKWLGGSREKQGVLAHILLSDKENASKHLDLGYLSIALGILLQAERRKQRVIMDIQAMIKA